MVDTSSQAAALTVDNLAAIPVETQTQRKRSVGSNSSTTCSSNCTSCLEAERTEDQKIQSLQFNGKPQPSLSQTLDGTQDEEDDEDYEPPEVFPKAQPGNTKKQ